MLILKTLTPQAITDFDELAGQVRKTSLKRSDSAKAVKDQKKSTRESFSGRTSSPPGAFSLDLHLGSFVRGGTVAYNFASAEILEEYRWVGERLHANDCGTTFSQILLLVIGQSVQLPTLGSGKFSSAPTSSELLSSRCQLVYRKERSHRAD